MQTKTNEQALDAFIARKVRIDEMLTRLQALSNDHFYTDPDTLNWGHVGDLGHIEAQLQQIVDFAFQEGEYAK
ncbi:MAG: hypothetical protein HQM03_21915 [Magnetococcales bacterium]|nr:hypothetical protein [Magnetococcales bacterium]